ncbi:hypothetical protein [Magnetofaba australis]|uniref:Uncharacterized protein n=1 Tax=Magnetofaba australis IT-1 TaxID=1434232 RepID=A0A1Y2K2E5_9PROT|nr:hypothetical protein [Magnetofaba australis]OSM01354.1 hypothetical protein MAIT1_01287 [Magnetofaba australis IT-1]
MNASIHSQTAAAMRLETRDDYEEALVRVEALLETLEPDPSTEAELTALMAAIEEFENTLFARNAERRRQRPKPRLTTPAAFAPTPLPFHSV